MRKRQPSGKPKETCSSCGKPLEANRIGKQCYCRSCHAAYMRATRKYSELSDEEKKKDNARSYLHVYVRRGKIKKEPCLFCGSMDVFAYQHDYSNPLEVTWLCKDHRIKNPQRNSARDNP